LPGIRHALLNFIPVKIQTGKIARIGSITKTEIYRIGAVIYGRLECRQTARRANQIHVSGY
jgi:hypothetical protein